jgi:hypothetical protein
VSTTGFADGQLQPEQAEGEDNDLACHEGKARAADPPVSASLSEEADH